MRHAHMPAKAAFFTPPLSMPARRFCYVRAVKAACRRAPSTPVFASVAPADSAARYLACLAMESLPRRACRAGLDAARYFLPAELMFARC